MFSGMGFRVAYSNGKKEVDAVQPTLGDAIAFAEATVEAFGPGHVTIEPKALGKEREEKGGSSMGLIEEAKKILECGGMASVMPKLVDRIDVDDAMRELLNSIEGLVGLLESAKEHNVDVSDEVKQLVGLFKQVFSSNIFDTVIGKVLEDHRLSDEVRNEVAVAYVTTYKFGKFILGEE